MSTGTRARGPVLVVAALLLGVLASCGGGVEQAAPRPSSRAAPSTTTPSTTTIPPPTTTAAPLAPPPAGNPWPAIGPAPAGHHAILAIGDSTMGQGVHSLPAALARHGFDAVLYDAHVNASGLLDPINGDGLTPPEILAEQLAAHPDVDTVLFEWLNVCAFACADGDPAYGSPAFFTAWHDAARTLVGDARARGLRVLWVIPPPPPPALTGEPLAEDWDNQPMRTAVAVALAEAVSQYPITLGVDTIDWWTALSDATGQYQPALGYDGALHQVRASDRVHLTEEGSARASEWTVAALAQLYAT